MSFIIGTGRGSKRPVSRVYNFTSSNVVDGWHKEYDVTSSETSGFRVMQDGKEVFKGEGPFTILVENATVVETTNYNLTVENMTGSSIKVSSVNGNIDLGKITGDAMVSNVNGNVSVVDCKISSVSTVNGNVNGIKSTSDNISSVNGDVKKYK